jgi:transposase
MGEPESSCVILSKLDLDDVEEVVCEAYHRDGSVGRPTRNPMGIFKALMVKRLQQVPSDRELYRRLWNDSDLRMVCDLEDEQKPYHPSQLTQFRNRIGTKRLERIMKKLVRKLLKAGVISGETVVMDATFIKAYSKRDPHENFRGSSDPEARVGRNRKTYELGYRYFRTHGPARERRIYKRRAAVERMNSRLKEQLSLNRHRVRGLKNITIHALLCTIAMLITALAAVMLERVEKARSIILLGR